jgi:RimJ/RimL family protein N-acetyltransferase
MIKVRGFELEDMGFQPLPVFDVDEQVKDRMKDLHNLNLAYMYTLEADSSVVGVIGCAPIWPGVGEGFTLLNDRIYDYPKEVTQATREMIQVMFDGLRLHRMQCHVKADYEAGHKWAKGLGFKREGLMKKYLPNGEDAYMYGRTQEWVPQQ